MQERLSGQEMAGKQALHLPSKGVFNTPCGENEKRLSRGGYQVWRRGYQATSSYVNQKCGPDEMRVLYKTFIFFIAIIVFLKLLLLYLQTKGIYGSVRLEPHPGAVASKAIGDEQSARANASIER